MIKKTYLSKYFFAPESLAYHGDYRNMLKIFLIIQKCLLEDPNQRPEATWIIIMLFSIFYYQE